MELIFGVVNNIRVRPDILPAWFVPKVKDKDKDRYRDRETVAETVADTTAADDARESGSREFAGAMRKDDFPLFYLLVDYVHREGRPGDFARTGVLYIIETASRSRDLQRWLIESDLATLMATGLGAQYSQLSRYVMILQLLLSPDSGTDKDIPFLYSNRSSSSSDTDGIPHVVALSDHAHLSAAVHRDSEEKMHAFLTYLLFWQDAIGYCKSVEVNDTLLDHFQVLFLEQLLSVSPRVPTRRWRPIITDRFNSYPSLLESSDVDGGSTSAVTNYLSRILESVEQPALIHRILHFLLASPSDEDTHAHAQPESLDKKSPMYPSRRKSLDMLAQFTEAAPKPSPALFNLVDLVLVNIRSKNIQTVTATLRLISVIVRHHQAFTGSLFKSLQCPQASVQPRRTVGAFNMELQDLIGMATTVFDDPSSTDQSYGGYLASASLVVCACADELQLEPGDGEPRSRPFTVRPDDDALIAGIMDMLVHFFTNSVMTNLALTNVIAALASSSLVSLDGWLLVQPDEYQYTSSAVDRAEPREGDDEKNDSQTGPVPFVEYEQPEWPPKHVPALSSTLRELVRQVELWRQEIADFDVLLAARRDVLTSEDNDPHQTDESTTTTTTTTTATTATTARSTSRQAAPGQASRNPSAGRPSTPPRGRKTSILERLGGSPQPSTSRSKSATPTSASASADPSLSRPQSHARSSQVAKDLRKRVVVNLMDGSSPRTGGQADSSPMRSDTASVDTSAPASDIGEVSEPDEQSDGNNADAATDDVTEAGVTVGHLLTNAVILYEFILELTALVQVRASVLDEVSHAR